VEVSRPQQFVVRCTIVREGKELGYLAMGGGYTEDPNKSKVFNYRTGKQFTDKTYKLVPVKIVLADSE
jgi:hypothetical protein